jgi:rhodanese-related sulfurtransferase
MKNKTFNKKLAIKLHLFLVFFIGFLFLSCAADSKVQDTSCSDNNCVENGHCEKDINDVPTCKCNEEYIKIGDECVKNTDNTPSNHLFVTGETYSMSDYDDGSTQRGIQRSYEKQNDIILDKRTGYYWQNNEISILKSWMDGKDYCDTLNLENKKWRLPTLKELLTIVDFKFAPAINPIFNNITDNEYWTSREYLEENAYFIDLKYGIVAFKSKLEDNTAKVICVSIDESNTYGQKNKLMWEDLESSKTNKKTWIQAIDYCENLELNGYNDWHLPNINELHSNLDETSEEDLVLWSSTPIVQAENTSNLLRNFNVKDKTTHIYETTVNFSTRCVRADNFASYKSGEWGDIILNSRYRTPKDALFIDIRTESEKSSGHPKNAITTVIYTSDTQKFINDIKEVITDTSTSLSNPKEKRIILTCASSGRSSNAVKLLSDDGFTYIEHIIGGTNKWEEFNLDWESAK